MLPLFILYDRHALNFGDGQGFCAKQKCVPVWLKQILLLGFTWLGGSRSFFFSIGNKRLFPNSSCSISVVGGLISFHLLCLSVSFNFEGMTNFGPFMFFPIFYASPEWWLGNIDILLIPFYLSSNSRASDVELRWTIMFILLKSALTQPGYSNFFFFTSPFHAEVSLV